MTFVGPIGQAARPETVPNRHFIGYDSDKMGRLDEPGLERVVAAGCLACGAHKLAS